VSAQVASVQTDLSNKISVASAAATSADGHANTASAAATSVEAAVRSAFSDKLSGAQIDHYTWVISAPTTGQIPGPKLYAGQTAKRISGSTLTASTTITFNIESRPDLDSAGTNLLSDEQTASIDGADNTTMANSALTADSWLVVDISGTSGTPALCVITLAVQKP
jgi:hypothetical protein